MKKTEKTHSPQLLHTNRSAWILGLPSVPRVCNRPPRFSTASEKKPKLRRIGPERLEESLPGKEGLPQSGNQKNLCKDACTDDASVQALFWGNGRGLGPTVRRSHASTPEGPTQSCLGMRAERGDPADGTGSKPLQWFQSRWHNHQEVVYMDPHLKDM